MFSRGIEREQWHKMGWVVLLFPDNKIGGTCLHLLLMFVLKAMKIVNILEYEITGTTFHYFITLAFTFSWDKVFYRGLASRKTTMQEYLANFEM